MFEDFRNRLQSERVELYNYFHDHTWGDDFTKFFLYTLPNVNTKKPDQTRQARHGAHFIVKRFCDFGTKGIHKKYEARRSAYVTRHREIVNNKECFVIRRDVLDSLAADNEYTAYVLFETDDSFSEMIEAKELRKSKYIFYTAKNQQGIQKFYYPIEGFPLHKKNFNTPEEDISFFQPQFLGRHTFTHVVHGYETDVHVYKEGKLLQAGHFGTITEFFNHFNLAEKGAKLISIQRMYGKKQNFTFKGLTFVFDDNWETVEYKIRLSKKQKELIAEIEKAKEELAKEEPEIEEIVQKTPAFKVEADEDVRISTEMSLSAHLGNENPPGMYWDEEEQGFKEQVSLWEMSDKNARPLRHSIEVTNTGMQLHHFEPMDEFD